MRQRDEPHTTWVLRDAGVARRVPKSPRTEGSTDQGTSIADPSSVRSNAQTRSDTLRRRKAATRETKRAAAGAQFEDGGAARRQRSHRSGWYSEGELRTIHRGEEKVGQRAGHKLDARQNARPDPPVERGKECASAVAIVVVLGRICGALERARPCRAQSPLGQWRAASARSATRNAPPPWVCAMQDDQGTRPLTAESVISQQVSSPLLTLHPHSSGSCPWALARWLSYVISVTVTHSAQERGPGLGAPGGGVSPRGRHGGV